MTHYALIHDRDQVRQFFETHKARIFSSGGETDDEVVAAPAKLSRGVLREERVCLVQLCARKKYAVELSRSERIFERKLAEFDGSADGFLQQLMRFEAPLGAYVESGTGVVVPQHAFALYMTLNPASTVDAFLHAERQIEEKLVEAARGHEVGVPSPFNLLFSACHTQAGGRFEKLDVDSKVDANIGALRALFAAHAIVPEFVIESKNGFHVVLDNKASYQSKTGRKALLAFCEEHESWVRIEAKATHPSVVVPGTLQGGFRTNLVVW